MNKRDFVIGACAVAGAGAPALAATGPRAAAARRLPPLESSARLTRWQRYVGQAFELDTAEGRVSLRLDRIEQALVNSRDIEQFTLVFAGVDGSAVPAGTQHLLHASGQRLAVYLEPSCSAAVGRAHFSLLA